MERFNNKLLKSKVCSYKFILVALINGVREEKLAISL